MRPVHTRKTGEGLDPMLRVAAGKGADDGEQIHTVLAETDDVERAVDRVEQRKRNLHDP
jgi:hypothetical protein